MEDRNKGAYQTLLYAFVKDILVVCPRCSGKALVKTGNFQAMRAVTDEVRVVCIHCGYNQQMHDIPHRQDKKQRRGKIMIFGAPVDPFFHLPVWFQTSFEGNTLWAYNLEHLSFLAQHIGARLRERNGHPYAVRSIGARLPRWMTAARQREAVLKAIEKLKTK